MKGDQMNLTDLLQDLKKEHRLKNDEMEEMFLPHVGKIYQLDEMYYRVTYTRSNPLRFTAELTTPTMEGISWIKKLRITFRVLVNIVLRRFINRETM